MQNKKLMIGIALLTFGFVLAGCNLGPVDGDDPSGSGDLGVGGLGPIGEPTTGRETVKESGVLLEPLYMSGITTADVAQLNVPEESHPIDGIKSWGVTRGRLSYELGKPDVLLESQILLVSFYDFGHSDEWKVTVKEDIKGMAVFAFIFENDGKNYQIVRSKGEINGKTARSSMILYIYVDGNAILERGKVKGLPDELGEIVGQGYTITFNAFRLELKKGWNLVQFDGAQTSGSNTETIITAKIADKDVPWSVSYGDGTLKSNGFRGTLR